MTVALQAPPFRTFTGLLALASVLLVAVGLGSARLTGRSHPAYWF
ncbi:MULTISPECIES: hypothetical protein [unclassified Streptomyces]|nr:MULTISPECIES: hypothetical protein [unclassified Streptomyces]